MISSSAVHQKTWCQTNHILALDMFSLQGLAEAQILHWAVLSPCWTGQDGKERGSGLCSGNYAEFHSEGLTISPERTHWVAWINLSELLFKNNLITAANVKNCKMSKLWYDHSTIPTGWLFLFYFSKGKKLWTTYLPAPVTSMALLDLPTRGFQAVLVALANCEVHVYRDKNVVSTIKTPVKYIEPLWELR